MAAYITVGATTSHGGKVISGSPHSTHNGIPISRKGDKVVCRKCKKLTTILTGDASFIVDGAPIARAGDVTSCGAKLIAVQQSFCESGFEAGGIEQAAPLVFPKSDPDALFASLKASGDQNSNEMSDEELHAMNDQMIGDAIADGGMTAELDRSPEARAAFQRAQQKMGGPGRNQVAIVDYKPERSYDKERYASIARVHGENSGTGQFAVDTLKQNNDLSYYNTQKAQIQSNRQQNLATRAKQQRPLNIKQGQPPSLYDEIGYENPMAKVNNTWKGELADCGKQAGTAIYDATKDSHAGFNAIATTGENLLNKDADALRGQAVDKATDTGKGNLIDKAKDIAPKPVRKAWDAYDDYNAVKEKGSEIKDAIPKDN